VIQKAKKESVMKNPNAAPENVMIYDAEKRKYSVLKCGPCLL